MTKYQHLPVLIVSAYKETNLMYFIFHFRLAVPIMHYITQGRFLYTSLHHHTLTHIYSYGAMYKIHHPTDNRICAIFAENPDYFHRCMVD